MIIHANKSLVFPYNHSIIDNYISNKFVVSTIPYKRIEQKLFELFVNQIDYEALEMQTIILLSL